MYICAWQGRETADADEKICEKPARCRQEADRMWSQLTVEKSTKRYNDPGRLIPGARFEYMGEYHVFKDGKVTSFKVNGIGIAKE